MTGWTISVTEAVAGLNWNFVANIVIISKGFSSGHPVLFFLLKNQYFCKFQLDLADERYRIKTSEDFCDFLSTYCNQVYKHCSDQLDAIFRDDIPASGKDRELHVLVLFLVETSHQKIKCPFNRDGQ